MLNLLLAIASSALVSITMRLSETKIRNNIAMLAVNYMMCTFLAWAYTGFGSFRPLELGTQTTVILGSINGVLYLAGFVLLHFLSKKRRYDGQVALGYAAWYGLGRCIIEGLRMDSLYWGPFRVSQWLAGFSCVAAVAVLLWQHFKPHPAENLWVNQVAAKAAAEAAATEENAE